MRTLSSIETTNVSAAAAIHLPTVVNQAVEYGSLGVLMNIVVHGATLATVGQGLLLGAGVGACYALVRAVTV